MASAILQRIKPRVEGVSEGGGGVGGLGGGGGVASVKNIFGNYACRPRGHSGDEANILHCLSCYTHRFNFCFQKAMGTN